MTHEQRASLIRKLLFLLLAAIVVAAVWLYPKPVEKKVAPQAEAPMEDALEINNYHLPGDANCEKLADILNKVQKKYGRLVVVKRIDVKAHPELAVAQGVKKVPYVIIVASKQKVFEFEGQWSQEQVERKVEEILRGLKRVGKDWRPTVAGMKPAAG